MTYTLRSVPKPSHGRNSKKRSTISKLSPKEDARLKVRSNGVCEKCDRARATERAHIVRRHNHSASPVAEDYAHLCVPCHRYCDGSLEGREWLLRFQDNLREKDAG